MRAKVRKCSQETGLPMNQIYQYFMFERFLERLSKSKYKKNFIIKGGCLLSSIMGSNIRTTMDIDSNITGLPFSLDKLSIIIKDIIEEDLKDNVKIVLYNAIEIKEVQEYKGYRFYLKSIFNNIEIPFHIDISTGDVITPRAIDYQYKKIMDEGYISLMAYNMESIIAEKIQAILFLKKINSRMKDFYDIHYFVKYKWSEINFYVLKEAIIATFNNRNTRDDLINLKAILTELKNCRDINILWEFYQKKNQNTNDISFIDIINSIEKLTKALDDIEIVN